MTSVAIILNPAKMANPDLDVRYDLPDAVALYTKNQIMDDGFDYLDDNKLAIFLKTDNDDSIVEMLGFLGKNEIKGNRIMDTAVIATNDGSGFRAIHPVDYDGDLPDFD